jgi:hypothetical protein
MPLLPLGGRSAREGLSPGAAALPVDAAAPGAEAPVSLYSVRVSASQRRRGLQSWRSCFSFEKCIVEKEGRMTWMTVLRSGSVTSVHYGPQLDVERLFDRADDVVESPRALSAYESACAQDRVAARIQAPARTQWAKGHGIGLSGTFGALP